MIIIKIVLLLLYLCYWIPAFILAVLLELFIPGGLDQHIESLNKAMEQIW